ncbi:MAG: cupin domain-containing protein [Rhodospirillaceae bacterium]|nr:cupin domain-containing protein [Rhodospirillaceae bacterium]
MDFDHRVAIDADRLEWAPSPLPGVDRRRLEREAAEHGRATSIVRYQPGASFSEHLHPAGEEYLVLDGTFSDGDGDFSAGWYVRNPPGSRHAPFSRGGCTLFVKLCQMKLGEPRVAVDTRSGHWRPGRTAGHEVLGLYDGASETVVLERLAPGGDLGEEAGHGGLEILVLDGVLTVDGVNRGRHTWLRVPAGTAVALASNGGARWWAKRGHVPRRS